MEPKFPPRVINIRGTNASGKTTLMKKLLRLFGSAEIRDRKGRTIAYRVHFEPEFTALPEQFTIIGDYNSLLGGCDVYPSMERICKAVEQFSQSGDVLFEGILVSLLTRPWIKLADSLPEAQFIFATLNTPLDVCLKRREKRWRKEGHKGNSFNPEHMTEKFYAVRKAHKKLEAAGMDVRWLPYKYGTQTLVNWLLEGRFAPKEK